MKMNVIVHGTQSSSRENILVTLPFVENTVNTRKRILFLPPPALQYSILFSLLDILIWDSRKNIVD